MEWDTAAEQAILEAAGGRVETLAGAPLPTANPALRTTASSPGAAPRDIDETLPFGDFGDRGLREIAKTPPEALLPQKTRELHS